MKKRYSLLAVAAVFAISACTGGSGTFMTPATGPSSAASPQTHTRVAEKKKAKAGSFVLFGDAALVSPGNNSPTGVQASTDGPPPAGTNTYGGVDFGSPVATLSQLNTLSTDDKLVSGTNGTCAFGAPRFDIGISKGSTSGTLFVNIPCGPVGTWSNSGNTICNTCIVQPDGTLCGVSSVPTCGITGETYMQAENDFGTYSVTDVDFVVDSSNGAEVVDFDNTQINNQLFTYESGDSCKKGGWQLFTGPPGPFKNQGDCVSYFNNGK